MGVCKIARWFKTAARSDRDAQPVSSTPQVGRNEYYRNLLQQFASHCQTPNGDVTDSDWIVYLPKEQSAEQSSKKDNRKLRKHIHEFISGIPHIRASEIFEIGCVAGSENRCLELVSAEWHNTKVTLKRHAFPACRDAIKADVEILSKIRHPNILLLMATTHTNEHNLVSIFEPVDCTLYNYIHEQGERINVQGVMQIGMKLADALKYCHMRGYIHTAISSHCVYFASDKTIKLGGWELARGIENFYVERDYERYLRVENFKWQAPAIYYGQRLSKKIDVYCLMLLLWEMCTGSIPWSGYDQSNVERQYTMRKRDVIINLQNVPPILRNLLEAGLHRDEAKITLDMDKIGRKLHRLLMIHEEDERNSTCVSEHENNNNDLLYNDTLCRQSSPPVINKAIRKPCVAQLHRPVIEKKSTSNQFPNCKKEQCTENFNTKSDIKKSDASVADNSIVSPVKVKAINPCIRCVEISNIVQEIDERNNARANIKRLKKLIASKREDFFYGNDSTLSSPTSPKATSTLLSQENSPTYVQCKPASHTTTMEPKCNASPTQYRGTISKLSYISQRKAPYTGMPASIKHAIIQPQVLHSDTKSFYESTLWRKEKEICISRMGRDTKEALSLSQQLICSVTPITDDDKAVLTTANATYTIEVEKEGNHTKNNHSETNNIEDKESPLKDVRSDCVSANVSLSSNKSLQDLKAALDRATEIINLGTSKICNSTFSVNNMQECETVLKNPYVTKYDDNQELKVNNRSMFSTTSFLGMDEIRSTKSSIDTPAEHEEILNQAFMNNETLNSTIMKPSNESQILVRNQQSTNSQKTNQNNIAFINTIAPTTQKLKIRFKSDERDVNIDTLSNKKKINAIKDSRRRHSLPMLDNLAVTHTPKLTCKKNAQGNQYMTEDIYIDDEFGSKLNYNLVLLDNDYEHLLNNILNDNESLPQTTEL